MNIILLEKAYSCYMVHLDHLNYGKANNSYCLVYDAILALANNITDAQFEEFFINNLNCIRNVNPALKSDYLLNIGEDMNRVIMWTLNQSEIVLDSFSWNDIEAKKNGEYPITTNTLQGFNYFYVSVPQGVNVLIHNELNMKIYDSLVATSEVNQLFSFAGTMTTKYGTTNNVYKKKDVYNTHNPVLFKVTLY